MKADMRSIFLLPIKSDEEAAGKLTNMPGIVEAAATMPVRSAGVPKLMAKGLRTGFFDMVELRIASAPTTHNMIK